jgi:hypothetical protein
MVRVHVKVHPRRWYYAADRLGLLVWQDFVRRRKCTVLMNRWSRLKNWTIGYEHACPTDRNAKTDWNANDRTTRPSLQLPLLPLLPLFSIGLGRTCPW